MQLSEDQIIKLAPDAASVKAGKGLASAAKWVLRGASDRALWGHCQGSGKNPYQTQVDLQNIAFKCSCPSHKFPCKHSLGLLFLYASQPDLFTTGEEPDWVKEWLEKRAGKVTEKKEKADKPVDVEAQAKRQEARHKKVLNGVDDLRAYLVAESYKHLDQLSPEWQDEIRTLVGYPQAKEEVLANGEQVSDDWLVVASESLQQDRLTVEYNWLYGRQTCRYALFLQFLTPGALTETALLPGSVVAADVAFYKGVTPTRVLFREQKGTREPFIPSGKGCCAGLAEAMQVYRESMTRNPFTYEVPVLVSEVRLVMHEKQVWIKDSNEYLIPLTLGEAGKLKGFAVTGGREFTGFFLAGERSWRVLSLWIEDKYYTLSNEYNG